MSLGGGAWEEMAAPEHRHGGAGESAGTRARGTHSLPVGHSSGERGAGAGLAHTEEGERGRLETGRPLTWRERPRAASHTPKLSTPRWTKVS